MIKKVTIFFLSCVFFNISIAQEQKNERYTYGEENTKESKFDWEVGSPKSSLQDPDLRIDIPFVVNGKIPIQKGTEHHFNMMKRLSEVENVLYAFYDAKYRGFTTQALIPYQRNVMTEVGRSVTLMDGYARHFNEDISMYMKELQELVKRYQKT